MALTLGIDVAVRAAHRGDAGPRWSHGVAWQEVLDSATELEQLWSDLDLDRSGRADRGPEPTRNAWIVVAEWFRRRGARVVMVPTTQSADLRKYYSKHTKNDRIDSELLARLPLLHPEGLREYSGQGPADPLRRLVKQRSTMIKRRTAVHARLDASSSCSARPGMRCSGRTTASPRWSSWPATPTRTRCCGSAKHA